nr:hypothetical protein [Candidatus Sigynarchaeota archaeon]
MPGTLVDTYHAINGRERMVDFEASLKSLYILREGLPVFTREYNVGASEQDTSTLVSGFLTALASFLKDMKDFGEMRCLTTSTNVKFSFYQNDGLLFVACTDGTVDEITVDRFLRRISMRFLESYQHVLNSTSMVNTKSYAGFETILKRELASNVLRGPLLTPPSLTPLKSPVPRLLIPHHDVARELHMSNMPFMDLIHYVDGKTDIDGISKLSGIEGKKVDLFMRYLVKNGVAQM